MNLKIVPVSLNRPQGHVKSSVKTDLSKHMATFAGEKSIAKKGVLAFTAGLASLFLPLFSQTFANEPNLLTGPSNAAEQPLGIESPWDLPGSETPLKDLTKEEIQLLIKEYEIKIRQTEYPLFEKAYKLMHTEVSETNDQFRLTLPTFLKAKHFNELKTAFKKETSNLIDIVKGLENLSGLSNEGFPTSIENMLKDDNVDAQKKKSLETYLGYYKIAFKDTEAPGRELFNIYSETYPEKKKIPNPELRELLKKYEDISSELLPKIDEANKRLQEIEK